ncbi:hypothetical protein BsWGS_17368 [Bradybaena similaris]
MIFRQSLNNKIFVTLIVAFLLGGSIIHFLDLGIGSLKSAHTKLCNLMLESTLENLNWSHTPKENNSQTVTSSTAVASVVLPHSTTMTFSNTVVDCKESPYIECFPPNPKPKPGKIFRLGILRKPRWMTKAELDITGCQIKQCVVEDVTNETEIVVIHGEYLRDYYSGPQRMPHQIYAIQVAEAPFLTHSDYVAKASSALNRRINLIITYRHHRGFFNPYQRLQFHPKPLKERSNYYKIAKAKTKTAMWLVSHCDTQSQRERYVKEMQKYVDIDIFGKCGKPCPRNNKTCNALLSTYKFYLAFENSLCKGYITEKFFRWFHEDLFVIPVVRGGADYDNNFPNSTYINAAHFATPKDLALHLKHLAADLETYSKLLEYKDLYREAPFVSFACKICIYAHTHDVPEPSETVNLTSFLGYEQCHEPTDL